MKKNIQDDMQSPVGPADAEDELLSIALAPAAAGAEIISEQETYASLDRRDAWYRQAYARSVSLESIYEVPPSIAAPAHTDDPLLDSIQASLLECYGGKEKIETPSKAKVSLDHCYINLALVNEEMVGSSKPAHPGLRDIKPERTLIIGEAGVGKSVLCQYIAYQWSQGKLWGGPSGRFKAVFWLRLRDLRGTPKQSIAQHCFERCMQGLDRPDDKLFERWLFDHRHQILFVLDGYDEVAELMSGEKLDHGLQHFLSQALDFGQVILTSRPYHYTEIVGRNFQQHFQKKYRNIGFKPEDVDHYVRTYFGESASLQGQALLDWKETQPVVKSIIHIPFQLALLCELWRDQEFHQAFRENLTLTLLYEEIKNCRVRHLKWSETEHTRIHLVLAKLAFEGMQNKQYEFTHQKLMKSIAEALRELGLKSFRPEDILQDVLKLGFLKSMGEIETHREQYYFVHLTYQEYYAACYIAELFKQIKWQIIEKRVHDILNEHKYSERYERVWWFVSGLLRQAWSNAQQQSPLVDEKVTKTKNALVYYLNTLQMAHRDLFGGYELGLLARCLEETGLDERGIQEVCPEGILRIQRGLHVLRVAASVLSGVTQADLERIPFCQQLILSPRVTKLLQLSPDSTLACQYDLRRQRWWIQRRADKEIPTLVNYLAAGLRSQHEEVRNFHASAIRILHSSYLEKLLANLEGVDSGVRAASATALGQIISKIPAEWLDKMIEALLAGYKDNDDKVRAASVAALGKTSSVIPTMLQGAVIKALLEGLKNKEWHICNASVEALGQVSLVVSTELQDAVIEALLEGLKDKEWYVRKASVKALGKVSSVVSAELQDAVIEVLLEGLEDKEWYVRKASVKALGKVSSVVSAELQVAVIKTLLEGLKYKEWYVRDASAETLCQVSSIVPAELQVAVIEALLVRIKRLVRTKYYFTIRARDEISMLDRVRAVIPLELQGAVIEIFLTGFKKESPGVLRQTSAMMLCQLRSIIPVVLQDAVINALLAGLKRRWIADRYESATALGHIILEVSAKFQSAVVDALLEALKDEDHYVRKASGAALRQVSSVIPVESLEALIRILVAECQHKDSRVRDRSATALGQVCTVTPKGLQGPVVNALLRGLEDEFWRIRAASATALGQIISNIPAESLGDVIEALLSGCKDNDDKVRAASVAALGQVIAKTRAALLGTVIEILLAGCKDNDDKVRAASVAALGQVIAKIPAALLGVVIEALLVGCKDKDAEVHAASATALDQIISRVPAVLQSVAVKALLAGCTDKDDTVRAVSEKALRQAFLTMPTFFNDKIANCINTDFLFDCLVNYSAENTSFKIYFILLFLNANLLQRLPYASLLLNLFYDLRLEGALKLNREDSEQAKILIQLLLKGCQNAEFSERLSYALVYLSYVHQWVFSISQTDEKTELLLRYQDQIITILDQKDQIECMLSNIRSTYIHGMNETQHPAMVFPEVDTLVGSQLLWHLLNIPTAITQSHGLRSLVANPEKALWITLQTWVVAIGCFGAFTKSHAFLLLEGMDQYGKGAWIRYDLCFIDRQHQELGYKIKRVFARSHLACDSNEWKKCAFSERKKVLYQDVLKDENCEFVSWPIQIEEARQLVRECEQEARLTQIPYSMWGSNSTLSSTKPKVTHHCDQCADSSPAAAAAGAAEPAHYVQPRIGQAHNCLTWAREKVKKFTPIEYKKDDQGVESGLNIPSFRISQKSSCLVM